MLVSAGDRRARSCDLYEETPEFEIVALGHQPDRAREHVFGNRDDDGVSWTWLVGSCVVVVARVHARPGACATGGRRGEASRASSLEAASKWYGTTVALSEVSFALGPGVTGLLGKNGAGKSTALKLLAGFATPDRGTVRVLGIDPRADHGVHRRLGVLPDRDGLWPFMSPLRLVSTLARLRGVADPEAAARRALAEVDFDPDDRRPVRVLSKGNRQRVKLAQALAHDPEVLLLDEPLNGLDPQQRRHVVELVRDLGEPRPHGARLLARAARGRAHGAARRRARQRPAGGRGHDDRHPRPAGRAPAHHPRGGRRRRCRRRWRRR